jgi:hypothetical protein
MTTTSSSSREKEDREQKLTTGDVGAARPQSVGTDAIANAGKVKSKEHTEGAGGEETQASELSPLFSDEVEREFRTQWHDIQTGFVDEPRRAVERADELVARLMQQLAQSFSDQRSSLERQWEQSDKISTEDLRVALRRYRSFFERLLAI